MEPPSSCDRTVWVASGRISEALARSQADPTATVALASYKGFHESSLEFLSDWQHVQRLSLLFLEKTDLSGLRHLPGLTTLLVDGCSDPIDFAWTTRLRNLYITLTPSTILNSAPQTIEVLHVAKLAPSDRALGTLPTEPYLHDLSIVDSRIESLDGVERFAGLKTLRLALNPRLRTIRALTNVATPRLELLDIRACRSIEDFEGLQDVKSLRVLRINQSGSMKSLGFTRHLPLLEELRFVETNVEDGDMSPCLRLKRVGFTSMRHYTHKLAKLKELIGDDTPGLPRELRRPRQDPE